jgi:hypothetical protein
MLGHTQQKQNDFSKNWFYIVARKVLSRQVP